MKLVVGLGNPGREYKNTRHNIGFYYLDLIANKLNVLNFQEKFNGLYTKIKYKNEDIILIEKDEERGLSKIRTSEGFIGYVKSDKLTNETTVRTAVVETPQVDGKINMVWDDFYSSVPDRTGTTIEGLNVNVYTMH